MILGTVRPTRHRSAARVSRGLPARTSGRWGGDERWEGGCTDAKRGHASQQGLRGQHPHEKEGTEGNAGHRGPVVGARQGHGAHAPGVRCRGRSTRLRTPPLQPIGVVLPTRATPVADGCVGHHDAACAQELFRVAGAQGAARGEPEHTSPSQYRLKMASNTDEMLRRSACPEELFLDNYPNFLVQRAALLQKEAEELCR
jgi:hypothetical protein